MPGNTFSAILVLPSLNDEMNFASRAMRTITFGMTCWTISERKCLRLRVACGVTASTRLRWYRCRFALAATASITMADIADRGTEKKNRSPSCTAGRVHCKGSLRSAGFGADHGLCRLPVLDAVAFHCCCLATAVARMK